MYPKTTFRKVHLKFDTIHKDKVATEGTAPTPEGSVEKFGGASARVAANVVER